MGFFGERPDAETHTTSAGGTPEHVSERLNQGWVRMRGNSVDFDPKVTPFETQYNSMKKAFEQGKDRVWVNLRNVSQYGGEGRFVSREDLGEFLQNPLKFVRKH